MSGTLTQLSFNSGVIRDSDTRIYTVEFFRVGQQTVYCLLSARRLPGTTAQCLQIARYPPSVGFSTEDSEANSETRWGFWHVVGYSLIDIPTFGRRIYYTLINSFGYYPNFSHLSSKYARAARFNLLVNLIIYPALYFMTQNLVVTALAVAAPFSCTLLSKILAKAQHHDLGKFSDQGPLKFSRTLKLQLG